VPLPPPFPPSTPAPPAGGSDPANTPTPDRTSPTISRLSMSPRAFAAKQGATLGFGLSEPARVAVTIERLLPGRKVRAKCAKPNRRNRNAKACRRAVRVGTLTRAAVLGTNRVVFDGRVAGRSLKPGAYRATARALDAAGNASRPAALAFKIVRGRR
jgi:hypothetical protein